MLFGLSLITRVLAVVGIIAIIAVVFVYFPSVLPFAQTEWSKIQPPRCATAADCVLANNSCCSNQSGNWTCAALDAHCAPNYAARVSGCWCGSGLCAANYSCEPLRPTATVELPPFPPEDLEGSEASATPSAAASSEPCIASGESCCRGDLCSKVEVLCIAGTTPQFKGCDENCTAIVECVPAVSPSPTPSSAA